LNKTDFRFGKLMLESPAISARTLLGVQGPGRFLGELDLLTGQASFTTAVVREPGEVLAVPVDRLRQVVSSEPSLSDLLLRACLFRRSMLIGLGSGLRIIGSRHSPASRRLRDFAARNRLPHTWVDIEEDRAAKSLMRELGFTPEEAPVVIWGREQVLRNPSNTELARAIGLRARATPEDVLDLLVVARGRPASPPPFTARRRACSRSCSTPSPPAVRPAPRRESRTTSDSRLGELR
jgi:thioredoxin reductase (NADPH)